MFLTIVLALLFVIYGIPLILYIIGAIIEGIGELFESKEGSIGCVAFIIIAIIIIALIF